MWEQTRYRRNMLQECMIKIKEATNNITHKTFIVMNEEKFSQEM